MKIIIVSAILIFVISCSPQKVTDEKPIARVYDDYLYVSDMKDILKNAENKTDSLQLIRNFTDKWAKNQLLFHLAEKNLSEENKDVAGELENYKLSLLIYKYQQLFVSQKLDTMISDKEYDSYYSLHPTDFLLDKEIIKAIFVQLPKSAPSSEKIKILMTSEKENDIRKLDDYCNRYAYKYDDFKNQWVSFTTIVKLLPTPIDDISTFLKTNKFNEFTDSSYFYFLYIKEFQLSGTTAPIEFAREIMKPILLTERKIALLNNLEINALNTELNNKNVEIFNP
jgi:hypothetical protein